ncbi:MAG: hypothetical protein IJD88_03420 [Clostridia bacterium]|nr:hypothetical protein [Clostridia bacterium]
MKKIFVFLSIFFFIFLSMPTVHAQDEDFLKKQYEALGVDEMLDVLDDDTLALLDDLGLNEINFESLFNVSPGKVFSLLIQIIRGKVASPVKILVTLFSIVLLFSVCESLFPQGEKIKLALNTACSLVSISVLAKPIFESITRGMSAIDMTSKVMFVFVPIFVAIISLNGNPLTAASYNSLMLLAAQTVSQMSNYFIKPCVAIFFALGLSSSVSTEFNFRALADEIKKIATIVLSFIASMFFSFLSLRGGLANASDSMGLKGVKFLLSSFIPVVGGAISEGYSSILGSLSLLKGVVGTFGICAVALINIPIITELLIWSLVLRLSSAVAGTVKLNSLTDMFKIIADVTTFINVVVILNCAVLIVSTGLLFVLKGGAT